MLDKWTPAQAAKKLGLRLRNAREVQQMRLHPQFERNERTVYTSDGADQGSPSDISGVVDPGAAPDQEVSGRTGVNYSFKNVRYIHAQMSANPPATIPRPATSDPEDRRRARAADAVMRFALRQYSLQEKFDQCNLNALIYGTGFIKTTWDACKGDIVGINKRTGQLIMEGDISVRSVSPWRMFVDPDAETWEDVRYVFEELTLSREEAIHRWPKRAEMIEALLAEKGEASSQGAVVYGYLRDSAEKFESITVYEYWEKGLPSNAMLGRYAVCLEDGKLLEAPRANPFSFAPPPSAHELEKSRRTGRQPRRVPPTARLPYHPMTDIDVPGRVWGKSFVEYEAPLQELLNRLDSVMLENLQAHGVARLILPDGVDLQEGALTNSPWDVVRLKNKGGGNPGDPKFMEPMPLPASLSELRGQTKMGIDDMAGVNEAMFGQQSRETSGFSMQYSVNQGQMIRRRLFNKYVLCVESVYRAILDLVRKHWKDERTVQILGREKAFQAVDLKGADIDGGYDLVVEYGTSLSLDPMTRRQEILALQPILDKANIPPRVMLSMLKLGELEVIDDLVQLAEDRQRELFEEMLATGRYIKPEEFEDHENMLAYALTYVMTSEFKYLTPQEKEMVRKHIRDRGAQAAKEKAPPLPPGAPGPAGVAGPEAAGMPAGPAVATPPGAVTEPAAL
jgi:hypothetical protein